MVENHLFFFDKSNRNASNFSLYANTVEKIDSKNELVQISSRLPTYTSDNKKIKFRISKFGHNKSIIIFGICTKRLLDSYNINGEEPESLGFCVFERYLEEFRLENVHSLNKVTKTYANN